MGKKRKLWWIVGGFVILLLGFLAGLTVATNTPDARLERVLDDIIAEFGFEFEQEYELASFVADGVPETVVRSYATDPRDGDEELILSLIEKNCDGCTVGPVEELSRLPLPAEYTLIETSDAYESVVSILLTSKGPRSIDGVSVGPRLGLEIERRDHVTGLLDRVRAWLPW